MIGSLTGITRLIGIEFNFYLDLTSAAKHSKTALEIILCVPICRLSEAPLRVHKMSNTSGMKISDLLTQMVVTDGVPLAQIIMNQQDIYLALGVCIAML